MAFAAGVLLGVVTFDIFPEIISEIKTYNFNSVEVMIALVLGFLIFHILEKSILPFSDKASLSFSAMRAVNILIFRKGSCKSWLAM